MWTLLRTGWCRHGGMYFFIIFQCEGFLHCNHIVSVKSCACPKKGAARCSDPSNSSWLIPQKWSHHAKVNGVGVEFAVKKCKHLQFQNGKINVLQTSRWSSSHTSSLFHNLMLNLTQKTKLFNVPSIIRVDGSQIFANPKSMSFNDASGCDKVNQASMFFFGFNYQIYEAKQVQISKKNH